MLSVETGGPQAIAHWSPTPDLAHTDNRAWTSPPSLVLPNPKAAGETLGDFFIFIFCLTAFCLFIEKSSLRFLMALKHCLSRGRRRERGTVNELAGSAGRPQLSAFCL